MLSADLLTFEQLIERSNHYCHSRAGGNLGWFLDPCLRRGDKKPDENLRLTIQGSIIDVRQGSN